MVNCREMRRNRYLLLCLALLSLPVAPAKGEESWIKGACEDAYRKFYRNLGIERPEIPVDIYLPRGGGFDWVNLTKQEFYDRDKVYLGIANNPKAGAYHFFVVAGEHTFDAPNMFNKAKFDSLVAKKGDIQIPKGVLFELDVPPDLLERIAQSMKDLEGSRNLTCLHGVCRVLRGAGIRLHLPGGVVRAKPFVLNLLNGKLSDGDTPLKPEQIRLLASSSQELEHFLENTRTADWETPLELSGHTAPTDKPLQRVGVGVIAIVTTGGIGFYLKEDENRKAQARIQESPESQNAPLERQAPAYPSHRPIPEMTPMPPPRTESAPAPRGKKKKKQKADKQKKNATELPSD
jgi:hypothetical protein